MVSPGKKKPPRDIGKLFGKFEKKKANGNDIKEIVKTNNGISENELAANGFNISLK